MGVDICRCLADSREEDLDRVNKRTKLRAKLMADLRDSYNGCEAFTLGAPPQMGEDARVDDEVTGKEKERESLKSLSQGLSVLMTASSEEELMDRFLEKYEEFVSGSAEEIDVSM